MIVVGSPEASRAIGSAAPAPDVADTTDAQRSWEQDALQRAAEAKDKRRLLKGIVTGATLAALLWGLAALLLR
jgi:hypothetical protein